MSADSIYRPHRQRRGCPPMYPEGDAILGMRFGRRVVIGDVPYVPGGGARRVKLRCECGHVTTTSLVNAARSNSCRSCSSRARRGPGYWDSERDITTEQGMILREARERCPELWLDDSTDPDRRAIVTQAIGELVSLMGPLSLSEAGELLDISRERVRQIEHRAMRCAGRECVRRGVRLPEDRGATMAELAELRGDAA